MRDGRCLSSFSPVSVIRQLDRWREARSLRGRDRCLSSFRPSSVIVKLQTAVFQAQEGEGGHVRQLFQPRIRDLIVEA